MIIIDCGACQGEWFQKYISPDNQILAIEALPANVEILERKFGHIKNIVIAHTAVGNTDAHTRLYVGPQEKGAYYRCSIYDDKADINDDGYVDVEIHRLSRFIKRLPEDVDILKLDVEGAEYDVFEDLLDSNVINRIKKIVFEEHGFHRVVNGKRVGTPSVQVRAREVFPRVLEEYDGILRYGGVHGETFVPEYLMSLKIADDS